MYLPSARDGCLVYKKNEADACCSCIHADISEHHISFVFRLGEGVQGGGWRGEGYKGLAWTGWLKVGVWAFRSCASCTTLADQVCGMSERLGQVQELVGLVRV